jgi:hypothetical protein
MVAKVHDLRGQYVHQQQQFTRVSTRQARHARWQGWWEAQQCCLGGKAVKSGFASSPPTGSTSCTHCASGEGPLQALKAGACPKHG